MTESSQAGYHREGIVGPHEAPLKNAGVEPAHPPAGRGRVTSSYGRVVNFILEWIAVDVARAARTARCGDFGQRRGGADVVAGAEIASRNAAGGHVFTERAIEWGIAAP